MCSRILWADNGQAVVVARNMDWKTPWPVDLWLSPRGSARDGRAGENSLTWSAVHGALAAAGHATVDGMNEAGLAAHMLWLTEADYGVRDTRVPGLSVALWAQFYLDRFATVAEAVEWTRTQPMQIVGLSFEGLQATGHLALEDKTGDSAIIEYIGGVPRIYHDRTYTVLTNSPPFDQQLAALKRYRGFGGELPLPGTTQAADRYVRAAYYRNHLPQPVDRQAAVAGVISVARNVAQPFGEVDPDQPNISPTRWRTVCDLTNGAYYFESTSNPTLVVARLSELDFAGGVRKVDLTNRPERMGDVTDAFEPAAL